MNRRKFLKMSSLAASTVGIGLSQSTLASSHEENLVEKMGLDIDPQSAEVQRAMVKLNKLTGSEADVNYNKFLSTNAKIGDLTESARTMVSRDRLLRSVLDRIPTPERAEQIHQIIVQHILAEEAQDVAATMATLDANPVFESLPEGKVYRGHKSVADDYAQRYQGLTRKLHITNMMVDKTGAFVEMVWEGRHTGVYKGIKPASESTKFHVPMTLYYEVNSKGLICRESLYYDQYLGALSLDLIPDILQKKLLMVALNPGLLFRLD